MFGRKKDSLDGLGKENIRVLRQQGISEEAIKVLSNYTEAVSSFLVMLTKGEYDNSHIATAIYMFVKDIFMPQLEKHRKPHPLEGLIDVVSEAMEELKRR